MTTALSIPMRKLRSLSPLWNSPLDRFFRNDLTDFWGTDVMETIPSLNLTEDKNHYLIELAAPGLKKEDFNVNVEGNLLTISSNKETESKEEKEDGFSRREYNYSSFSRTVTLPDYAEAEKITAKYVDGVLSLTIPKKPEAQKIMGQKIKVQ